MTTVTKRQNRNEVLQGNLLFAFGNDHALGFYCDIILLPSHGVEDDEILIEMYFGNQTFLKKYIRNRGLEISQKVFSRCMSGEDGTFSIH
jgi:hypothetical protein